MNAGRNGGRNHAEKRLREFRSRKNALDLIRRRYSVGDFAIRPPSAVTGPFMRPRNLLVALVLVAALGVKDASAQPALGAQGAEGEPHRLQQWLVPSPDLATEAHAVLFRPPGEGPFPLAVIAHASTQNVMRRAQMPQPEYRALAAWLVARGFAVLVPERSGHGATGGHYLEDQGGCDEADYAKAGRATADSIVTAMDFMRGQSFVRRDGLVIVGHSAGAWGALALAARNPQGLSAIVAFAPGRGGHANDFPDQVCAAAYVDRGSSGVRQKRARAGDLVGLCQPHVFLAGVVAENGRRF